MPANSGASPAIVSSTPDDTIGPNSSEVDVTTELLPNSLSSDADHKLFSMVPAGKFFACATMASVKARAAAGEPFFVDLLAKWAPKDITPSQRAALRDGLIRRLAEQIRVEYAEAFLRRYGRPLSRRALAQLIARLGERAAARHGTLPEHEHPWFDEASAEEVITDIRMMGLQSNWPRWRRIVDLVG